MMSMTAIMPELFPLSKAMVNRLTEDRKMAASLSPTTSLEELEEQLAFIKQRFGDMWKPLLHEVEGLRDHACEILQPAMEYRQISTDNFLKILHGMKEKRGHSEAFTVKTVSRWRDRGLVRYDERDHINYDTAIAVLMMRLADHRRDRGFLPPGDHKDEPYMYVWRQDTPSSPIIPCGLPLADDIPAHALLYSRWRALGLLRSDWLPFGDLGSVRWRGVSMENGVLFWSLTEQDLMRWDSSIIPLSDGILYHVAKQASHTLANLVLLKQASLIFQQQSPFR